MVTDKKTLLLLSRLADAQLALAESMRGITSLDQSYPTAALERIAEALTLVEASLLEIAQCKSGNRSNGATKLH
ncbi:hypothetical protein [Pseudomonas sp. zfem002]|uniref:hypothetical protein n=1 Tax=Pseudomonas sp. zfem002 TaxID=3078197 RepID=UPI00292A04F1|nr:hypothetical protein [Pseudomonas sp. zfem002]MDU9394298.1 hypothetical protein [Pseudomonas sp. zfem002]